MVRDSRIRIGKRTKIPPKTNKDAQQDREINSIKRKVSMLKPELKYNTVNFGTPGTGAGIDQTVPLKYLLNGMVQGSAMGQRDGNKFRSKYLELRCTAFYVGGSQSIAQLRCVIYIDKSPRGSSRRLMGSSTPYTDSIYEFSDRNHDNFKVLFDKTYQLDSAGSGTNGVNIICKKKLNFVSDCSRSNNGDITDFETGALYVLFFTNAVLTPAYPMKLWGHANLAYTDA